MKKIFKTIIFIAASSFFYGYSIAGDIDEDLVFVADTHASLLKACEDQLFNGDQHKKTCNDAKEMEAQLHNPITQFDLGMIFYKRQSISGDNPRMARFWFEKSAKQGLALSQKVLGAIYMSGDGVRQDVDKGIYWFEQLANNGDAEGDLLLGFIYSEGSLVPLDFQKSLYHYGKVCDEGNQKGCDLYRMTNEEYLRQKNKQ